jgi:hypothetical protein
MSNTYGLHQYNANCSGMQDSSWARCPQMEGHWKKKKTVPWYYVIHSTFSAAALSSVPIWSISTSEVSCKDLVAFSSNLRASICQKITPEHIWSIHQSTNTFIAVQDAKNDWVLWITGLDSGITGQLQDWWKFSFSTNHNGHIKVVTCTGWESQEDKHTL